MKRFHADTTAGTRGSLRRPALPPRVPLSPLTKQLSRPSPLCRTGAAPAKPRRPRQPQRAQAGPDAALLGAHSPLCWEDGSSSSGRKSAETTQLSESSEYNYMKRLK